MKRTVKPIKDESLSSYWRRCNGGFGVGWYAKAVKYAELNGAVRDGEKIINVRELNK